MCKAKSCKRVSVQRKPKNSSKRVAKQACDPELELLDRAIASNATLKAQQAEAGPSVSSTEKRDRAAIRHLSILALRQRRRSGSNHTSEKLTQLGQQLADAELSKLETMARMSTLQHEVAAIDAQHKKDLARLDRDVAIQEQDFLLRRLQLQELELCQSKLALLTSPCTLQALPSSTAGDKCSSVPLPEHLQLPQSLSAHGMHNVSSIADEGICSLTAVPEQFKSQQVGLETSLEALDAQAKQGPVQSSSHSKGSSSSSGRPDQSSSIGYKSSSEVIPGRSALQLGTDISSSIGMQLRYGPSDESRSEADACCLELEDEGERIETAALLASYEQAAQHIATARACASDLKRLHQAQAAADARIIPADASKQPSDHFCIDAAHDNSCSHSSADGINSSHDRRMACPDSTPCHDHLQSVTFSEFDCKTRATLSNNASPEHIRILGLDLQEALQLAADMIRGGSRKSQIFLMSKFISAKRAPAGWRVSAAEFHAALKCLRLVKAYPVWAMLDYLREEERTNEELKQFQQWSRQERQEIFGDSADMLMDPEPERFVAGFTELAAGFNFTPHVTIMCLVRFSKRAHQFLQLQQERAKLLA